MSNTHQLPLNVPEYNLLRFVARSASDSASVHDIVETFGNEYLTIAESLASRNYLDRLYYGGYRLQARGRQALMEYRLLKKDLDEIRSHEERNQYIKDQNAKAEAEDRIAHSDLEASHLQETDHAFQLQLHKSGIRHSWIQWTLGAAGSVIGFILGAFVEYRADFISHVLSFLP